MEINEIKKLVSLSGNRFTQAREDMIKIFLANEKKHYTIDELISDLSAIKKPNIATIYNNLDTFVKLGVIKENNFNGRKYYELNDNLHAHFTCKKCGKIFDLQIPALSCLNIEIQKKYGATVTNNLTIFEGICKECDEEEKLW